jgi:hypothetical protein
MSDDDRDEMPLTPAQWATQLQQMSEEAAEQQMELFRSVMGGGSGSGATPFSQLGSMGMGNAVFKTRVQSGGRISIPDAEREALDIEEGDLVQAVVVPISKRDQS